MSCIKHIETPGTHLNKAWATLPAPPMAIGYYHLPNDALWVDTLKCIVSYVCVNVCVRFGVCVLLGCLNVVRVFGRTV